MDDAIKADPMFKEDSDILQSIPGIGKVFSQTVISELSELAFINQRQAAALVGVAPMNHDSGLMRGKRAIKGGRYHVRATLYMAAMTANKNNPIVKAVYDVICHLG